MQDYKNLQKSGSFLSKAVFFTGWLLSPFSVWNDSFINIPISYILANLFIGVFKADFLALVLVFYWVSNCLGLFMMYFSGRKIFDLKRGIVHEIPGVVATVLAYSLLLILLDRLGVLRSLNSFLGIPQVR